MNTDEHGSGARCYALAMAGIKTLITADQFFHMPFPDQHVELSEGEIVRMSPAGYKHGIIAAQLTIDLGGFVNKHKLGRVFAAETGFRLSEQIVRAPDVAFVSQERIDQAGNVAGFFPGAPDLAVEVISPDDSASDLQTKIQQYFKAGTRLLWAVYPLVRQVHVYRSPTQVQILEASDTLLGEDVLPGFSVRIETIFQ